jgi:hypothetical protein
MKTYMAVEMDVKGAISAEKFARAIFLTLATW